ncbi:retrovirus-related Pol polyprotein from transposon 297 [Trichonephila clavipes]|nr:retrovirus-related Pol polyprotein from transposon 297 [Trichonephila clavipes]
MSNKKCRQAIRTTSPIPTGEDHQYADIDHPLPLAVVVPATETRKTNQDIILGWNFLKASGALIDYGRSELTLDDLEVTSEDVVLKPLRLCIMKDCRLPAYSIKKILVVNRCREDLGNVIVEGSKLLALKKEVFMPSMFVTLRRGKTEIWVVNGQSQEKVIPQGMCVAFAEPFCPDCNRYNFRNLKSLYRNFRNQAIF